MAYQLDNKLTEAMEKYTVAHDLVKEALAKLHSDIQSAKDKGKGEDKGKSEDKGKEAASAEELDSAEASILEVAGLAKLAGELAEKLDSLQAAIAQKELLDAEAAQQPKIQRGFAKPSSGACAAADGEKVNVLSTKRKATVTSQPAADSGGATAQAAESTSEKSARIEVEA